MTVVSPICDICATSAREVNWSDRLRRFVCLSCYEPGAPTLPAGYVPYVSPPPPPPSSYELARRRIQAALGRVAPTTATHTGLAGTCPLCRGLLFAHVGAKVVVLDCEHGCDEEAVWTELKL